MGHNRWEEKTNGDPPPLAASEAAASLARVERCRMYHRPSPHPAYRPTLARPGVPILKACKLCHGKGTGASTKKRAHGRKNLTRQPHKPRPDFSENLQQRHAPPNRSCLTGARNLRLLPPRVFKWSQHAPHRPRTDRYICHTTRFRIATGFFGTYILMCAPYHRWLAGPPSRSDGGRSCGARKVEWHGAASELHGPGGVCGGGDDAHGRGRKNLPS